MSLPEHDRELDMQRKRHERAKPSPCLLGRRMAEKLVLDDISTGASNDLERASKIARNMVTRYGFSEKLGPVVYGQDEGEIFLGRDISQNRNFSENVAAEIDVEVRELVDNAYESAKSILTDHMDQLHLVAKYVYHHEKIDGEEFRKIMTGQMEWSPEDLAPMPDTVEEYSQPNREEQDPEQPEASSDLNRRKLIWILRADPENLFVCIGFPIGIAGGFANKKKMWYDNRKTLPGCFGRMAKERIACRPGSPIRRRRENSGGKENFDVWRGLWQKRQRMITKAFNR